MDVNQLTFNVLVKQKYMNMIFIATVKVDMFSDCNIQIKLLVLYMSYFISICVKQIGVLLLFFLIQRSRNI